MVVSQEKLTVDINVLLCYDISITITLIEKDHHDGEHKKALAL